MTRFALLIAVVLLTAAGVAYGVSLTGPRLAPTASGIIDRTHKTDRLKAPGLDIRVIGECRSA